MLGSSIVVVSGLPRSGTSLAMQMLQAGGIGLCTDSVRSADEDNPRGYFESETIKRLREGEVDLACAAGQAVKVVSPLLCALPAKFEYRVVFMVRNLWEVLQSQRRMLINRNATQRQDADDTRMGELYADHLRHTLRWIKLQSNMRILVLSHRRTIQAPLSTASRLAIFLNTPMEISQMIAVVDQNLYRQRALQ
jgi:hypothetical protein